MTMSNPKDFSNWPPEKQAEWRKNRKEWKNKYYASPGGIAALEKYKNFSKRRDQIFARNASEKMKKVKRSYNKTSTAKIKRRTIYNVRLRGLLADAYIATMLKIPTAVLREHLPNLLESKRQEILLKRQLNLKHNQ